MTARHQQVMAVEAAAYHELRFRRHPDDYPPRVRALIEEGLAATAAEFSRTKEHQKALKVRRRVVCRIEANWMQSELEEGRRLESMVRTLKREQSARGKPAAKPGT